MSLPRLPDRSKLGLDDPRVVKCFDRGDKFCRHTNRPPQSLSLEVASSSSNSPDTIQLVRKKLGAGIKKYPADSSSNIFIPRDLLSNLMTFNTVYSVIDTLSCCTSLRSDEKKVLAHEIYSGGYPKRRPPCKKLLAVLISIQLQDDLVKLMNDGINDSCLPFHVVPGISDPVSGVGNTVPEVGDTVPGVGDTVPEVSDTVPGISDTVPEVDNTVPGVGDTVPGVSDTIPGVGDTVPGVGDTLECRNPNHDHPKINEYDEFQRLAFSQWTYAVMAPYFTKALNQHVHYILDHNDILPILQVEKQEASEAPDVTRSGVTSTYGGFSYVQRVKFHPSHFDFDSEDVSQAFEAEIGLDADWAESNPRGECSSL